MYSKLDICNRALRLIGENLITTLDENTKTAEECKFLYPIVKREVIESYPWKCTRKKILLSSIYCICEESDYKYKFLLPFNCISVLKVNDSNNFKRDNMFIYAHTNNITLYYTADIDEKYMTLRLCKIISLKLALELVFCLLGDSALVNRLNNMLNLETKKLMQLDSEEGEVIKEDIHINRTESWLAARNN